MSNEGGKKKMSKRRKIIECHAQIQTETFNFKEKENGK